MTKLKLFAAAALCLAVVGCASRGEVTANYNVVPLPHSIVAGQGEGFTLDSNTKIAYPEGDSALMRDAEFLAGYIEQMTGLNPALTTDAPAAGAITLAANLQNENPEAYQLTVTADGISINGSTAAGTFYGVQTLRKAIPEAGNNNVVFPAVTIDDQPRFAYRGAHFDVSRHFFPADSVKTFIDMLALHNINTLHWHITDDQGWRIEIKSLPELTEIGSKRKGTVIGHNTGVYDSIPYGGFYTQEEARDIVKYAADRNITVIPEIDLPGHMLGALTAYPNLGCTGGPYDVWQIWGVSDDVLCAGNDSVYTFIDTVLGEIVDIFPSEYIHVGGDECPKTRWKECAKCQAKAKALGLKADSHGTVEEKLQSHIIHHASDFLSSKGRKMIGWDETLEGGLAPGAIVMSWRGEAGGIEAAKRGHDVIMTPNSYMYFDYYQTLDREKEPEAIGGYVPVQKVYSYEPLPAELTPEEAKHIIGVQANLWTEYIPTFSHVQYMELPRMAALAEVQWSDAPKDYKGFSARMPQMFRQYDVNGYNYATHMFNVAGKLTTDLENHAITLELTTVDDAPIHYTLDGTEPTEESPVYTEPVVLKESCTIKALATRPGANSALFTDSITFNKATAHPVTLLNAPHPRYKAKEGVTLVDGKFGTNGYGNGDWVGYVGSDLVATVDLEASEQVSSVSVRACTATGDWVFDASAFEVAVSENGKDFTTVASENYPEMTTSSDKIITHELKFSPVTARYVRVTVKPAVIPSWHPGAGKPGFVFVDEIEIN
ncbi:MAG: family 20 glycosylhydrolase [Muribaculaceae bacterium]|nr:family 20 glycosylhydrolase [Muribaculaceae bacterium]